MENNNCAKWSHLTAYSFKNACPIQLDIDKDVETTYIIVKQDDKLGDSVVTQEKVKAKTYPTLDDINQNYKKFSYFKTFNDNGRTVLFEIHADSYHLLAACLQKFFDIYVYGNDEKKEKKDFLILLPFSSVILDKLMLIESSTKLTYINEVLREVEHRASMEPVKKQCKNCFSLKVKVFMLGNVAITNTELNPQVEKFVKGIVQQGKDEEQEIEIVYDKEITSKNNTNVIRTDDIILFRLLLSSFKEETNPRKMQNMNMNSKKQGNRIGEKERIIKITTGSKSPSKIVISLMSTDFEDVHSIYPIFDSKYKNLSWQNLSKSRRILSPSYVMNEWWQTYCDIKTTNTYKIEGASLKINGEREELDFNIKSDVVDLLLVDRDMFDSSVRKVFKTQLFHTMLELMDHVKIEPDEGKVNIFVNNQVYEADEFIGDRANITIGDTFMLDDIDQDTIFVYNHNGATYKFRNIGVKRQLNDNELKNMRVQRSHSTKLHPEKYTWTCSAASKMETSELNQITPFFGSDTDWLTDPYSFQLGLYEQQVFPLPNRHTMTDKDCLKDSLYHTQLPHDMLVKEDDAKEYILDLPRSYYYSGCRCSEEMIMVDEILIPLKRKNYYILKKNVEFEDSKPQKGEILENAGIKPEEKYIDVKEDYILDKLVNELEIQDYVDLKSKWLAFMRGNEIFQMYYMCIDLSHIIIPDHYNWGAGTNEAKIKWNLESGQVPSYSFSTKTEDFLMEQNLVIPTHFALFLNANKVAMKFMNLDPYKFEKGKSYTIKGNKLIDEDTKMYFEILYSDNVSEKTVTIKNSTYGSFWQNVKDVNGMTSMNANKFQNMKHNFLSFEDVKRDELSSKYIESNGNKYIPIFAQKLLIDSNTIIIIRSENFFGDLYFDNTTTLSSKGQYLLADFETLDIFDVKPVENYKILSEDLEKFILFELKILRNDNPVFMIEQDKKYYVFTINRTLTLTLPIYEAGKGHANLKYLFQADKEPNKFWKKHPTYLEEYALLFKDIKANEGYVDFNSKWLFDKESFEKAHFPVINAVQTFYDKVKNFEPNESTFEEYSKELIDFWGKKSNEFFLYAYNEASRVFVNFFHIKQTIDTLKSNTHIFGKDFENVLFYRVEETIGLKNNMTNSFSTSLQNFSKFISEYWKDDEFEAGHILLIPTQEFDQWEEAINILKEWNKRKNRAIPVGTKFAIPIPTFQDFGPILTDLDSLQTSIQDKIADNAKKNDRHFIFQLKSQSGPLALCVLSRAKDVNLDQQKIDNAYKLSLCKVMSNKLLHGTVETLICGFDNLISDGVVLPKRKVVMTTLKDEVYNFATELCKNTILRNIFYTSFNENHLVKTTFTCSDSNKAMLEVGLDDKVKMSHKEPNTDLFLFATQPTNILKIDDDHIVKIDHEIQTSVFMRERDKIRMFEREKGFEPFF
tara:strand:- start:951 stop:5207 length:4257 start_codon:yes stop_codon:yes gene_type:complete